MKASEYAKALEKAIREKCVDCCGHSRALVRDCRLRYCPLWPYRMNNSGSLKLVSGEAGGKLAGQVGLSEVLEELRT